jgi:hypothetical protein
MGYHASLPNDCPPAAAVPMTGTIYRAIRGEAPDQDDLKSHRELGEQCGGNECRCWGASVWLELAHARHAQSVISSLRKRKLIAISVQNSHGKIMHTGGTKQPEHRTFWRDCAVNFVPLSQLVE